MKKYKISAYIFIIVCVVLAISFATYKVVSSSKDKEDEIKSKVQTEIQYVESKLLKIFNKMNNIGFENYKISVSEIDASSSGSQAGKNNSNESDSSASGGESGSGDSGDSSSSGSSDTSGDSSSSGATSEKETSGSSSKSSEGSTTTYMLKNTGVLTEDEKIDWNAIKFEVENMYTSIPTITLDLYQTDIDNQDILNFNTELDALTKVIREEDKVGTLSQLVKVYENIIKFTEKCCEEQERIVAKTKLNIYKAYSKLDEAKWNEIVADVKVAAEEFTKLMTRNKY